MPTDFIDIAPSLFLSSCFGHYDLRSNVGLSVGSLKVSERLVIVVGVRSSIIIGVLGSRRIIRLMDVGRSSGEHSGGALVDVADVVVPALGSAGVVVYQSGVYPFELCVVPYLNALLA